MTKTKYHAPKLNRNKKIVILIVTAILIITLAFAGYYAFRPAQTTIDPVPTVDSTPVPTVDSTPVPTVDSTPVPTVDSTPVPTVDSTPVPTTNPTTPPTQYE
jgi:flagellar basal body-associated protein FliL